jgi:hypothetical protein
MSINVKANKDKSTVIIDPKTLIKPEFERELEKGLITKIPKIKNKKQVYVNGKGQRVDENGNLLTKRGQIDKRSLNTHSSESIKKRWQQVAEMNKTSNPKVVATVDSDTDSEPEFEIETITPTPPQAVEPPPQPTRTEMFIKEEEEKRKKFDEEIFKLKEENTKLKSGLVFNDHLNRISHMARSTKLKF